MFTLTERFLGAGLPAVQIADLRGQAREGRSGVLGRELEGELIDTLQKGKQAILFLNRRGNSRVIGCALCGWVPECPSCSTFCVPGVSVNRLCPPQDGQVPVILTDAPQ